MNKITPIKFWTTAVLAVSAAPFVADPASAGSLVQWLDPFTVTQTLYINGTPPRTLTADPATISSPLLGSVTRRITGTKTAGDFTRLLNTTVSGQSRQFSFNAEMGVAGNALIDYGTFRPTDFTARGNADSIGLSIDNLLVRPLSTTPASLNFTFNFKDSDGTEGKITRSFTSDISGQTLFLPFASATGSGGNGVLNFNSIQAFSFQTEVIGNALVQSAFNSLAVGSSVNSSFTPPSLESAADTPEPSTVLGLLAAGTLGAVFRRRARERS